jgi:hypothetical protein
MTGSGGYRVRRGFSVQTDDGGILVRPVKPGDDGFVQGKPSVLKAAASACLIHRQMEPDGPPAII